LTETSRRARTRRWSLWMRSISNRTSRSFGIGSSARAFGWGTSWTRHLGSDGAWRRGCSRDAQDFSAPNGTPFRSGIRRASGLTRGLGSVPVLVPVQHPIWSRSVATGISRAYR